MTNNSTPAKVSTINLIPVVHLLIG